VAGLPEEPAAVGVCVSPISEMAAKGVCTESTLAASGHGAVTLSARWHCITLALAALVSEARVLLAGWTAPSQGQLSAGPTAPFGDVAKTGVPITSLGVLTGSILHLSLALRPRTA